LGLDACSGQFTRPGPTSLSHPFRAHSVGVGTGGQLASPRQRYGLASGTDGLAV